MNKVAAAVGLSPEEFRRRNFLHEGEQTATGQVIRERLNLEGLLARALDLSGYFAKRTQFDSANPVSPIKQGIGFATFMHGAGFTGSGEVALKSVVTVEATRKGRVRILSASTEIGQGTNTIFSQIASDALDIPYEQVDLVQPDTAEVPNSGPTVASRTVMVVGKLVEAACVSLKQLVGATNGDFAAAAAKYFERHGKEARASSGYQPPPGAGWNDDTYQGDAYGAYAWAVYVATVSVDTRTYETRVDDFVALQEIGKVIHPVLAAGQIEGGVAQAIGFALYENCVWKNGRMANAQMTNYIMPTSADLPPIRVFFEENPYAYGPAGAKGIGELPMDGVAPAILNAVEHATGVSVNRIPMTPEVLMGAMMEATHG